MQTIKWVKAKRHDLPNLTLWSVKILLNTYILIWYYFNKFIYSDVEFDFIKFIIFND